MPDPDKDANLDEFKDAANKSAEAGIADESAAYDKAMTSAEDSEAADERGAQPS